MKIDILSMHINNNALFITLKVFSQSKNRMDCYLNDFEEIINGSLENEKEENGHYLYTYSFELTSRFKLFNDGLLKIQTTSNSVMYFTIYALDMWEEYSDDIDKIEMYFNEIEENEELSSVNEREEIDEEKVFITFEDIDEELENIEENETSVDNDLNINTNNNRSSYLYDVNGYDYSWLSFSMDQWSLVFTSNTDNLFARIYLSYTSNKGNILDDVKIYITALTGSIIEYDGYITSEGRVPNKIDIWIDGQKHDVCLAPTFPIKPDDEILKPGIRLTLSFKDCIKSYFVRKSFIYDGSIWNNEELFAYKL